MDVLPKNIDAEVAVIGAAMAYREALPKLSALTVDDFSDSGHKRVWGSIMGLLSQGKIPDITLLAHELGDMSDIGGLVSLARMMDNACMEISVSHYIDILKQKEHGRRLYFAARNTMAAIKDGLNYDDIETAMITAISKKQGDNGTVTLSDIGNIDSLLEGEEAQPFVSFGIPDLDSVTGGIRAGEICILAARTSVGKSAAAVVSTLRSAELGWRPLYFSGEMTKKQLYYRMLAYESHVFLRKFRDCAFTEIDKAQIRTAQKALEPALKRIRVNTEANTPVKLSQLVRLEQLAGGGEYLIIDHAGRMKADGKTRSDYEKMSEIANRIKDMALNLNVPILVLWQLGRGVEQRADKRPTLADLRDSGQSEEVADTVILLSRDNYHDKTISAENATVTIDVAKARDSGQTGEVKIPWKALISRPRIVPVQEFLSGEEYREEW